MMRRIELDYQKPAERPRRMAGWLLLIVGIALLFEMGMSYDRLQKKRAVMSHEVQTSKPHLDIARKEPSKRQFSDRDFVAALKIIKRLSIPWDTFFVGLESVNPDNVAILSIEPDMQTGLLRMDGEAKDYAAMLTLIAQMRESKTFADVFLLHHEIKRDDPQHPVGFTLSMRWVKPI